MGWDSVRITLTYSDTYLVIIRTKMLYPSIVVHIASGAVLVIAVIAIIFYIPKIQTFDVYRMLILILLLSVAIGTHGISHVILEKEYGYDPLQMRITHTMKNMECPCMKGMGNCPCMKGMGAGMGKCPFMKT